LLRPKSPCNPHGKAPTVRRRPHQNRPHKRSPQAGRGLRLSRSHRTGKAHPLWHEGNFNPGSYVAKRQGSAYGGFVACNSANILNIDWEGRCRIWVDNTNQGLIWTDTNFDPGSKANASAQVQWASGIAELGAVVTGADVTIDAGGPWVLEGLRTTGGANRIYLRVVWLRNQ